MDGDGYSNLGIPPSVAGDVRPEAVGATGIRQTSNGTGSFPFPIASLHDLATINTALGIARRWSCETCRKRKIRCDGVRPSCGFCVRKKIVPCIYVGTKDRADIDLARQFEAERRRRRTVKPDPPGKPAKKSKSTVQHGSWSVGPAVEGNSWIEPAEARCTSSYAETQLSGPADSIRQPYSSSAAYFDSPTFSATPGPQLPPLHTNWNDPAYRRPGSEPDEHYALITQFFKFPTLGASHVHKRSLLMSFDYISPLFRLALCACGALIARASSISKDVVQWYYDQACALAKSAMQNVSLETFQALLLLIQVANGHCQRSAWSATLRDAVQMAVSLNLNVDPDLLPRGALIEGSWLEKETRRRCWWACYLIERNLACTFFQTPVLSRDVCSVKPICPDNIWTSPKTPSELEVLYNLSADPRLNTLNFLIRITDIYGDIVQASIPEPLETMDLSAVSMREERLGQELEDFKNALPESSVLQLDRQWMYETMETDLFHFNGVVGCYLLYQGGRCLLMRRRALLYLREMSAALEGSRLVPDEANRVALQKALSSAVSMARFIAALLKWPGAVQRIPNIFIPPIVQGSMTLVMTDGLIAPFTRSPDFGEMSVSLNPGEIPQHLENYLTLLRGISSRYKTVTNMGCLLEKFRSSDWQGLETHFQSDNLMKLDRLGQTLGTDAAAAGVWQRRVSILSDVIRDFLSSVRTAREVSKRLSPLSVSELQVGDGSTPPHPRQLFQPVPSWADMPGMCQPHWLKTQQFVVPNGFVPDRDGDYPSVTATDTSGQWYETEPPLADNPDDGDDAMLLLDWLFSSDPLPS